MTFVTKKHSQLTDHELQQIGELKSQHWVHPVDSQIAWMNRTYLDEDVHILLQDDSRLVGYVAVVRLKVVADKSQFDAMGISCLCVNRSDSGMGWGTKIMKYASQFAEESGRLMCLLCKDRLVRFYEKCNYVVLSPCSVTVEQAAFEHRLMFCNNARYQEFLPWDAISNISIDRNF